MHWLTQNADRVVTLDEIGEATGLTRRQTQPGVNRLVKMFPQLEKKNAQLFIWHSTKPSVPSADLILLRVIRRKEGAILAIDEDTDIVYNIHEIPF
jgi:hypothetical protein